MSAGDPRENLERMVSLARGPKGEQGSQGDRGERGMSPHLPGRSIVVLFVIAVGLAVFAIFWINHAVNASAAAQRNQGRVLEQKLCTTLDRLAALRPPPGSPADNPSRAFEQQQHAVLAQLGPDVGCGAKEK